MRIARTCSAVLALASLAATGARAQTLDAGAAERVRLVTDEARRQTAPPSTFLDLAKQDERQIDAGGWVTVTSVDFRDDDHSASKPDAFKSVVIEDYRLWVAGEITDDLKFYVRGRKFNFDFSTNAGVASPDFASQENVTLDLAYVDWGFAKDWALRAGRQFQTLGRALVLSNDLDGAAVSYQHGPWQGRVFAGTTIDRDPNLDTSIIGFAQRTQDRDFYSADASRTFDNGNRAYGYLLVEHDNSTSQSAAQSALDFHYHSNYLGLGTEGSIAQDLHYYGEYVREGGTMFADTPKTRVDIDSNAFLGGLLYYPDFDGHPLATLEIAHGSGDPARSSVTNTFGGKLSASDDNNFLYYGSYDGGLALSPRLSNLNIARLGFQMKPFPDDGKQLPGVLVGTKLSEYWKDDKNGVISDPLATLAARYVGWGFDFFAGYKPLSDVSFLAQFGRFTPGSAYAPGASDASNRVLLTSTLSF